jgi:hypothetical protein
MPHDAPDPMPMPMPHGGGTHTNFTYREMDVVVHEPVHGAEPPMLMIGGQDVMVRREETGGYSAPMHNMFASYTTMAELARDLVDLSPVFIAQRYGRAAEAPAKPKRAKKGK